MKDIIIIIEKVEYERIIIGKNGLNKEEATINKNEHRQDNDFVANMNRIYSDNKLMWFIPEVW